MMAPENAIVWLGIVSHFTGLMSSLMLWAMLLGDPLENRNKRRRILLSVVMYGSLLIVVTFWVIHFFFRSFSPS
jgi:hypothetical protein